MLKCPLKTGFTILSTPIPCLPVDLDLYGAIIYDYCIISCLPVDLGVYDYCIISCLPVDLDMYGAIIYDYCIIWLYMIIVLFLVSL